MTLDLRSLAALRIALAALVLLDLLLRALDLSAFYTDAGVLPRTLFLQVEHGTWYNLHLSCGGLLGQALLFLLAGAASVAMGLGYRTRAATAAVWFLTLSLQQRNLYVLDGGDLELRVVLFWAMFLPLGERWSVDSGRNGEPGSYRALACFGYRLQLALLYLAAATLKSDPVWRVSGDALYYVFSIDQFATGLAHWATGFPGLLRPLSFAALGLEFAIGALLLFPWRWSRRLAVGGAVLLHLAIAACLHLGMFMPICIGCLAGLWPDPAPGPVRSGEPAWLRAGLALTCLYLVAVNVAPQLPEPVRWFGYLTQEQQRWDLFAPRPFSDDGWFVLDGELLDGRHVDLMRGGLPISQEKPASVSAQFANQRWRRWYQNLWQQPDSGLRRPFLAWLWAGWNRDHGGPETLVELRLVYMLEMTPPPGQAAAVDEKVLESFRGFSLIRGSESAAPSATSH